MARYPLASLDACFELRGDETYRKPGTYRGHERPLEGLQPGNHGYILVKHAWEGKTFTVLLHRIKFYLKHGWMPETVDHADTNKSNNSWTNLRPATRKQQAMNRQKTTSLSGYPRGVHKTRKRYQAQVRVDGKLKHLGIFTTVDAASQAVEDFRRGLHGEFYRP